MSTNLSYLWIVGTRSEPLRLQTFPKRRHSWSPSCCVPYSRLHEPSRWIISGGRLDHDRPQNRRATDGRTPLHLLSRMLLCIVEQSGGKALVPEYAQESRRRAKRPGRTPFLYRNPGNG